MPFWKCDECESAKDPEYAPCLLAVKSLGAAGPSGCPWVLDRNRMVKWRVVSKEEFMQLLREVSS